MSKIEEGRRYKRRWQMRHLKGSKSAEFFDCLDRSYKGDGKASLTFLVSGEQNMGNAG